MKKTVFIMSAILITTLSFSQTKKSFYDFKVKDIDGKDVDLHKYKGKKVLVVNVASECGFTPQYKELEELYKSYKDSGLVILGFPCNDFGGQEPGSPDDIKSFCSKNYGVTFPIMEKVAVKGKAVYPLYSWLQRQAENGVQDNDVRWNFNKFMVSEEGAWSGYLPSRVKPNDKIVIDWIMNR